MSGGTLSITILVVDDHPLVRESIALLLAKEADLTVVGACENADQGAEVVRRLQPAVALLDIEMPGTSSFQVARQLREEGLPTRFVFLSAYLTDTYIQEALALGPSGYLVKSASVAEIAAAVRSVAAGQAYFSQIAAQRLPDRGGAQARLGILTAREREVLKLVASDLSCKEIAARLGLSVRTVDRHKANIMEKLDIHSQVGLTRFAVAEGVCDPRLGAER